MHPDEFKSWEQDGRIWHPIGILNFWWRGYGVSGDTWRDPPMPSEEFALWLNENNTEIKDSPFGPPHIIFPTEEIARRFEKFWHIPGEARRLEFYKLVEEKASNEASLILKDFLPNYRKEHPECLVQ